MTKSICVVLLNQMCRYGRALVFSPGFRCCSPARFINNYLSTIHQREPFWLAIIDKALLEKNKSKTKQSISARTKPLWCDGISCACPCRSLCFVPQWPHRQTVRRCSVCFELGLLTTSADTNSVAPFLGINRSSCFAHAGSVASRPVPAAMLPWCLESVCVWFWSEELRLARSRSGAGGHGANHLLDISLFRSGGPYFPAALLGGFLRCSL